MKIDLLTNATLVDDAIRLVLDHQHTTAKVWVQVESTTTASTDEKEETTNQIF